MRKLDDLINAGAAAKPSDGANGTPPPRPAKKSKPTAAAAKKSESLNWALFIPGTDYGIRRTVKGDWYVPSKTPRGKVEWIRADKQDVKNYLEEFHQINPESDDESMPDVERAMLDALSRCVEFAGTFGGYREAGEIMVENNVALITRGIDLIEPRAGDCEFCKKGFTEPFPGTHTELLAVDADGNIVRDNGGNVVKFAALAEAKELVVGGVRITDRTTLSGKEFTFTQRDAILGWLQGALRTLREAEPGKWRHGHVLILIGLAGSGKTSLQNIITLLFTGRATDPELFFKDKTSFNEQMGEKEHWLMSDPKTTSRAAQEKFLGDIKTFVANVWMAIHPKGGKLINLRTFRRMTLALNPDNKALELLRDMAASDLDKVMILDFQNAGKWSPDGEVYGGLSWEEWEARMIRELPAFIYWLLNEYHVPEHQKHRRYNVVYHNPTMEPRLAATTADEEETEVKEIVGIGVFTNLSGGDELNETEPLSVGEVIDRVTNPTRSSVVGRAKQHPDYFYNPNHTRLGNALAKWSESDPPGEPKFHDIPPFYITRHILPGKKSKYSFSRGTLAEIKHKLAAKKNT